MRRIPAGFKDGKRRKGDMYQGMEVAPGSWKRQGSRFSPWNLQRRMQPEDALILAQRDQFQSSDSQDH